MSRNVIDSGRPGQEAGPNTQFYVGIALAVLLVVAGGWALWKWNLDPSADRPASERFATPVAEVEVAPDFSLQTLDGRTVKLSDYKGQVVLLNTWATWCPPCRAEMPDLEAYYREHQADGFVVLAVNSEERRETVSAFLKDQDFTFPVLLDSDGVVMKRYQVLGLPTSFIIDREGNVHGVWSGQLSPSRLREIVDPLL